MRRIFSLTLAAALLAGATPALADQALGTDNPPITQSQLAAKVADSQPQPYAMNYTDEAAQSLGIKDGRWEALDTKSNNALMPSLKAGVDSGGAMLKLQWHPGE